MKKAFLIGLMVVAAAPAFAADLPVRGAQPRAVEVYQNYWDGLYIGANAGFGTGKINAAEFSSDNATGFLGGLQVGANKQLGNFVIGFVTDIDGGSIDKSDSKLGWLGTTRGKVGFLFTPTLLVYGTGGVAYGAVNLGTVSNGVVAVNLNGFKTHAIGWAAGIGAEYALSSNWGLGLEYLHVKLDGADLNTGAEGDIFRGLLNYRF